MCYNQIGGDPMDNKTKIIKISGICKIVSKVLYICAITLCIAFIALAIAMPLTDAIKSITPTEAAIVFSVLALYSFFSIDLLWNITKFFEVIQTEQNVFSASVSKYVKKIAWSILIISCVPALLGSILIHLLAPDSIFEFRIEVVGISAGIVLFFLGLFFHYGADLQKQDDETL